MENLVDAENAKIIILTNKEDIVFHNLHICVSLNAGEYFDVERYNKYNIIVTFYAKFEAKENL